MKSQVSHHASQEAPVSIPLHAYSTRQVMSTDVMHSQLTTLMNSPFFIHLHPYWKIATAEPLTLCKLDVQQLPSTEAACGHVMLSLSINSQLKWTLYYFQHQLTRANSPLLSSLPDTVDSLVEVMEMIETLDAAKHCVRNTDQEYVEYWQLRLSTLHGMASKW